MGIGYDEFSIESIEAYARKSIGKRFSDYFVVSDNQKNDKGIIGNLYQEKYFGIKRNPSRDPDFKKANLELKVFGYTIDGKNVVRADQRLALTTVDYFEFESKIPFEESHLYKKCQNMLFVVFMLENDTSRYDSKIKYVRVYKFSELVRHDYKQIESDFNYINKKIKSGKADCLSESDTEYLAVSRTGNKNSKVQLAPGEVYALPRRFSFKQSYMSYLLQQYIVTEIPFSKSTRKTKKALDVKFGKSKSFDDLLNKIDKKYLNKNIKRCAKGKAITQYVPVIDWNNSKHSLSMFTFALFGIKSNQTPYLKKTNTIIKSVLINKNNRINESLSFPVYHFSDIVQSENWIESEIYNYFSGTRFVLMLYKEMNKRIVYAGHYILTFTDEELEMNLKPIWERIKKEINDGVKFTLSITSKGGLRVSNTLPGMADYKMCHTKTHSSKTAYKIKLCNIVGDSEEAKECIKKYTEGDYFYLGKQNLNNYGDMLPNGDIMTKQCIWINSSYILKRLKEQKLI